MGEGRAAEAAGDSLAPSVWALAPPVALFAIRPLPGFLLDHCGHGELLILFGFATALVVGHAGFEIVDLKGDLGALVIGALMAAHPKAKELATSLFGLKDLFLVGFFLEIGLAGDPTLHSLGIAALLAVVVVIKLGLYFLLHATDPDFWERVRLTGKSRGRLVMLTLPEHAANLYAVRQLTEGGFSGVVAAIARFPDEVRELEGAGVHAAFDLYAEAGAGFAESRRRTARTPHLG